MNKKSLSYKLAIAHILLLLLIMILPQCTKTTSNQKKVTISGYVIDEYGLAIKGASVSIGGLTVTNNNDGTFSISGLTSQPDYHVKVTASGYFDGFKNVVNIDGSNLSAQVTMLKKANLGNLPAAGGSVGATGLRVVAPSGSFTNADGSVYNGSVSVSSRYVTGNNPSISKSMPGGDFMAKDGNGNDGAMLTYGFVATEFKDQAGNKLTPNSNVKVAVTIPVGVNNPMANNVQSWGYDENTGKWSGSNTITQTGNEYFFPATTQFQNMDKFALGFGTIEGKVLCAGGSPSAYTTVIIQSTNYNNEYVAETNANGNYRVKVAAQDGSITFLYTVSSPSGGTVTVGGVPVNTTVHAPNLTTVSCGGTSGGNIGTTGTFTTNGNTYNGVCGSVPDVGTGGANGNIDVAIATSSGTALAFYNMPRQNSGTYSVNDAYSYINSSNLYALLTFSSGIQYASKGGTVTKTGFNTFTFSISVYNLDSGQTLLVTGSGGY